MDRMHGLSAFARKISVRSDVDTGRFYVMGYSIGGRSVKGCSRLGFSRRTGSNGFFGGKQKDGGCGLSLWRSCEINRLSKL